MGAQRKRNEVYVTFPGSTRSMFYLRKTGCLAQTAGPMHVGQPSSPFLGLLTGVLAAFSIPYWRWRVLHLRVVGERGGRAACLRACMWRARLGLGLQPPPVWQTRTWIMCAAFWADSKQAQMRIDTSPHTAVVYPSITDYVPHSLTLSSSSDQATTDYYLMYL